MEKMRLQVTGTLNIFKYSTGTILHLQHTGTVNKVYKCTFSTNNCKNNQK